MVHAISQSSFQIFSLNPQKLRSITTIATKLANRIRESKTPVQSKQSRFFYCNSDIYIKIFNFSLPYN
jgi:hypothetical protein